MVPWVLRDRWMRFALLTCGVLTAALFGERWPFPHYAAPITCLLFALVLQSMRHLRLWRWRGRPTGQLIVGVILGLCVAQLVLLFARQPWVSPDHWSVRRTRIVAQLKAMGGRHLVIVRYWPGHWPASEWVYNEADIDGAKVVWAREMDAAQNRKLLEYFKDRRAWLMEADAPYPVATVMRRPDR